MHTEIHTHTPPHTSAQTHVHYVPQGPGQSLSYYIFQLLKTNKNELKDLMTKARCQIANAGCS